ncbi:MAG: sigma-70 family RNA polymerase sigma factor [Anaerolineae bacterium]|nr:sigma-70 family RNA polymerase sigma factor [Anaerolineae bacterium]
MTDRTNEEWLADLSSTGQQRAQAIEDLRKRLERGLFFYLSHERSDLGGRSTEDLQHMAQDFVQDALIKVLDNLGSFRAESLFTTWATKIATRVAISELRRARWKDYSLETITSDGEVMPTVTSLDASPTDMPQPEDHTERQEILDLLDDAINTALTDRQRTALLAHAVEGMPVEEIARRMDTNRNALYKLIHDARIKLKHYLEQQEITLDYLADLFETT